MNQMLHQRIRLARLARPEGDSDRRRFQRFAGNGMMARIGQDMVEVGDLSLGGLRLPRRDLKEGGVVKVQLIPREGTKLHLNEAIYAEVRTVEHGPGWTGFAFVTVSYSLAKMIVRHMARLTGIQPYHFR